MKEIRCKCCGAPLNIPQGASYVTCSHCEARYRIKQTVPTLEALIERGNILIGDAEFEEAESVFKDVLRWSPHSVEGYSGLVKVEYRVQTLFELLDRNFDELLANKNIRHMMEYADYECPAASELQAFIQILFQKENEVIGQKIQTMEMYMQETELKIQDLKERHKNQESALVSISMVLLSTVPIILWGHIFEILKNPFLMLVLPNGWIVLIGVFLFLFYIEKEIMPTRKNRLEEIEKLENLKLDHEQRIQDLKDKINRYNLILIRSEKWNK